jgi:hypothetical protein
MDIKEVQTFVDGAVKALNKKFEGYPKETEAFVTMLKIQKKVGRLSAEVARSFGFVNKERATEPLQLDNIIAGAVLKLFVLARELDVDMEAALPRKMEMLREKMKAAG